MDSNLQITKKINHPGTNYCQSKTKDRESPKKSSFQHIPRISTKKNTNSCMNNETTDQNRHTSFIEEKKNGSVIDKYDVSPKNQEFFSNLDVMIRKSRLEKEVSESDDDDGDE